MEGVFLETLETSTLHTKPYLVTLSNMEEKQRQAFKHLRVTFSQESVIYYARKDGKKRPIGFLLTYLCDRMELSKTAGWDVAELFLEYLNIDNKDCLWLDEE